MTEIQWFPVNAMLKFGHGSVYEYRVRRNPNGTAVLIANGPALEEGGEPVSRREECADTAAADALAQQWEDESDTTTDQPTTGASQ